MSEKKIPIPARLQNVAENGHVAGASDIMDDNLQLTQAEINAMVLGGAISVGFSTSPASLIKTATTNVTLTATCSQSATSILIKKNGITIGSGSGTSTSATASVNPSTDIASVYTADIFVGSIQRTLTSKYVLFGSGNTYNDVSRASLRTSAAGTYSVPVETSQTYVFFVVPVSMTINRATMSGFDFPLESPTNVTIDGVAYKSYKSSNTYDAGDLTIVIS